MHGSGGLAALLNASKPHSWERQISALSDLLAPVLRQTVSLPADLIDAILASGDTGLIEAMASGLEADAVEHAPLRHRLASTGAAGVAAHAFRHWNLRDRRTVCARALPHDNGWVGPGGIVERLLKTSHPDALRPTVCGPFPDLLRHTLITVGDRLTRAEQLRGLLGIARGQGRLALAEVLREQSLSADVLADVSRIPAPREGATDPTEDRVCGALAALVAEAEATTGAIEELRAGHGSDQLGWRAALDWDLIGRAHGRRPFDEKAASALVSHPDCPDDLLLALCVAHPAATPHVTRPTPALIATPVPTGTPAGVSNKALKHRATLAIRAGLPADALLRATPAYAMLEALHRESAGPTDQEIRSELRRLVAERLGDDVARWRLLRANLKRHRGSTLDLLDEVGRHPAGQPSATGPWPDAKPLPDLTVTKTVTGVRAAFLTLLAAAPTASQLTLLGHLDDQTVHDLFTRGEWRDEWLEAVATGTSPAWWRALACRRDLSQAGIGRLATRDDSAANGQLFLRRNASVEQRIRVLSGRPLTPGRTEPVPLDPALRAYLMQYTGGSGLSPYVSSDAMDCADQELQHHILRFRIVYGEIPQLRLMLNLWRRHGKEAVRALVNGADGPTTFNGRFFPVKTMKRITELLDADDEAEALARLEATVVEGETPAWQIAFLRNIPNGRSIRLRETHLWHLDAIMEEHRHRPFPQDVLAALCDRPGCPREFREALATPLDAALASGSPPAEALGEAENLDRQVILRLLRANRLTWRDLLEHGRPCFRVLDALGADDPAHLAGTSPEDGRTVLANMVSQTLDRHPDALALAARMQLDFPGTTAELLDTAVVAVS